MTLDGRGMRLAPEKPHVLQNVKDILPLIEDNLARSACELDTQEILGSTKITNVQMSMKELLGALDTRQVISSNKHVVDVNCEHDTSRGRGSPKDSGLDLPCREALTPNKLTELGEPSSRTLLEPIDCST